ncbi:hypothetical protein GCM10010912_64550 [Paenibacillus albidus]|uniref:Uncharacterized protein n=1 Tax=Paenibacillus albidus TaxID=2041023 RepID=A0A917D5C2_9BACL|nr:hypothetical protein [Paenibacillus albidus]GGG11216.1 hypothetical protein GCM10010912_64550 [Paenibacillus albidus]
MKKMIWLGAAVVLVFALVFKLNDRGSSTQTLTATEAPSAQEAAPTAAPDESVIISGEITGPAGGKELSIWMIGGGSNNFGQESWEQGETISFSVTSEQDQKLEIGIMSIATEEVFTETLQTGTGTVDIEVPENGDYRIYIKNHSPDRADFVIKLNKELLSPLV